MALTNWISDSDLLVSPCFEYPTCWGRMAVAVVYTHGFTHRSLWRSAFWLWSQKIFKMAESEAKNEVPPSKAENPIETRQEEGKPAETHQDESKEQKNNGEQSKPTEEAGKGADSKSAKAKKGGKKAKRKGKEEEENSNANFAFEKDESVALFYREGVLYPATVQQHVCL